MELNIVFIYTILFLFIIFHNTCAVSSACLNLRLSACLIPRTLGTLGTLGSKPNLANSTERYSH